MSAPIIIGLTGYAGAGKDTVADALVTHAGFRKIAFADQLRLEVSGGYQLGDQSYLLAQRSTKETPLHALAFCRCHQEAFVDRMMDLQSAEQPDFDWETWAYAPRSPRQIMQWWGTEYRRAESANYWSTKTAVHIAANSDEDARWIITDCRFDNEAQCIRSLGGEIWQVQRPGHQTPEGGHASQTDGMRFNPERVLINGMDIPALIRTTLRALQASHGGMVINLTNSEI
jgi:hypothetical protein